ncbi:hypothetical protein ACI3KS_11270 [Microbacterium sp. ZW T5_45]|uniref:hypothetical protein n=1 Tax=Microbacterium sp. ZW T5_45 TaxID=3378080 RepID=UPI003852D05B
MGDARQGVTMPGDRVRMSAPGVTEIAQIVAGPNAAGTFLTVPVEPERSVESTSPAPACMKEENR